MINFREYEPVSSLDECVGKTVKEVHDGYEETFIAFEDGTYYEEYTYSGDPRDL